MRVTLDVDETLLREAMAMARATTKQETVERALRALIRRARSDRLIARHTPLRLHPAQIRGTVIR